MVTIESISAKGFKSFAKKTELMFGKNYNCVIGPNGSGKSNIVDLITFVLGKSSAKQLRAEKSSHLIYNGGKHGNPAKEAEASIVFDNSSNEFPVKEKLVELKRIVRHSGNSIYKINNQKYTRQQVLDLLAKARISADGHNIVLQGDIIHFMEMKPEERMEIIEEVSGISVYEDKKQKAMSELEKVQSKLSEADIILTERNTYLKELKSERDQAVRYREIEDLIKRSKATLINKQLREKDQSLQEIKSSLESHDKQRASLEENISNLKKEITNNKEEIKKINEVLDKTGKKSQSELSKEIESLKESIIKQSTRLDVVKSELTKIQQRRKQITQDSQDIEKKLKDLDSQLTNLSKDQVTLQKESDSINSSILDFRKKHGLTNLEEVEESIEKKQNSINNIQEKKQSLLREYDQKKYQLEDINNKLGSKSEAKDVKSVKQEFKTIQDELTSRLNKDAAFSVQLSNFRRKMVEDNEKLARLRMLNITSSERTAADLSIKRILESGVKGLYNKVSELGEVNKKYSLALEIAAGARMNSIVVEDDETASKCIKYLKEKKLGVVAFLPLNKIKAQPAPTSISGSGIHGSAISLINYDQKFKNVFSYVFGPTLVVEDVETARKIGIGKARMVTIQGDLMETSGAMIGGFRARKHGSGFKEKGVSEDIIKLETEISELDNKTDDVESEKTSNEDLIYKLREKKALLEVEIMKIEKSLGGLDLTNIEKKKSELSSFIKQAESDLKNFEQDLSSLNKELLMLKEKKAKSRQASSKELTDLESNKEKLMNNLLETQNNIKNFKAQKEAILLPEKNKLQKILVNNDKENQEFSTELEKLTKELVENKNLLKEKETKEKAFFKEFEGMFNTRTKHNNQIQKVENNLIREEERIRSLEQKINIISIDRARVVAEMEGLKKEFEPFEGVSLRNNLSLQDLKFQINNFEKEMSKLGSINLRALEVYEKLEEEYNKLKEKEDTLKKEKDDVMSMMKEIDDKKKDLFLKTFKKINEKFKEIFTSLSTKGEAYLELTDKEKPLEGGLTIKVKIVGNKYLDLKSLSGGEKTMAALAMIFAIQEYQPASFYVMDEVDAALDKTNSSLLSKQIQKYSKNAQYIVISHNDTVISEADQIYGVSMQQGVSKVISLKI